ncbi:hypothetical protein NHQ30_011285 [Ciborinia camelliae]|nr:hypothetical protein NHQ30_011285 [Ciborinia camelliae]
MPPFFPRKRLRSSSPEPEPGPHPDPPSIQNSQRGYEDYFGPAPHHRFIKAGNTEEGGDDLLERIRNFPKGATTEDQRLFRG